MKKQHNREICLRLAQFTVERADEAIFWHGPDGTFEQVNEAACRPFGI